MKIARGLKWETQRFMSVKMRPELFRAELRCRSAVWRNQIGTEDELNGGASRAEKKSFVMADSLKGTMPSRGTRNIISQRYWETRYGHGRTFCFDIG
jgi:hypothetical protein